MKRMMLVMAACLIAMASVGTAFSETKAIEKSQEWFQDAKFGMFIHWGVYSILAKGEWVMNNDKMTIEEYEKLYPQFNPVRFNADEWCRIARDAGMKYITITSKHHDGFCMYDSKLTDYDIMNTPFGRDVMAELKKACDKYGLKLFFYYSQLDWHHPDYYPRGRTGQASGRPDWGDWNRYLDYHFGQVRELCTNYGDIGGIWFDGWWDRPGADWKLNELYSMIHELQPGALIGNNHHQKPNPGENFQNFEQDLPGQNTAGFNEADVSHLPLEMCMTMNHSWGYNQNDHNFKSTEEIIHYLVNAAGLNANLLLNVGPTSLGEIQPEAVERLRQVGQWLDKNGKTIYGTRGGPIGKADWGTSTIDGETLYLHVFSSPGGMITIPNITGYVIKSAHPYHGASKRLRIINGGESGAVFVPDDLLEPVDTIIQVNLCKSNRAL